MYNQIFMKKNLYAEIEEETQSQREEWELNASGPRDY